jgi:prepilin-type N-terminal cleavage/methylation domain-containing protein
MITRKGFTLIELLVVISIISMLSSVTLASLKTARDKAVLSAKMQTIDQIVLAFKHYYLDNGQYPQIPPGTGPVIDDQVFLKNALSKYISRIDYNGVPIIIGYWQVCSVLNPCDSFRFFQTSSDSWFNLLCGNPPSNPTPDLVSGTQAIGFVEVNFAGSAPKYSTWNSNYGICLYPI